MQAKINFISKIVLANQKAVFCYNG